MNEIKQPVTMEMVEGLCKIAQKLKVDITLSITPTDYDVEIQPVRGENPSVTIDTTMYP